MTKHRSYSAALKRQVAEEFIAGETLHALAKRPDDTAARFGKALTPAVMKDDRWYYRPPEPRGTPPGISVEGHLAQMLTTAQPDPPSKAAKAIAEAAKVAAKEEPGGGAPGLC